MKFNYENLEITNLTLQLINEIYILTKKFPQSEQYCLVSQIKRSATSILLNIAEGSGKYSKLDFARFIRNSIGSTLETDANLKIALNQKFISNRDYDLARKLIEKIFYKLIAFEKSLIGKRKNEKSL